MALVILTKHRPATNLRFTFLWYGLSETSIVTPVALHGSVGGGLA